MEDQDSLARDGISQDAIIDAAIEIIVRNGFTGLTLRPLASSLGVSVAVIKARMGAKDQLIDRIVELAARRDRQLYARWASLAAQVAPGNSGVRAALADLAFQDWVTAGRQQAVILVELVHHHALQGTGSQLLDQWLASAGDFWSTMIFGSPVLADIALGYVLDEAGFSLAAGDDPAYAVLRVLCLQRLALSLIHI